MSENLCKECGQQTSTLCNVCNVTYSGCTKDHLASQEHKEFKALVKSLKELDHDEKNKLFKKFVKNESEKSDESEPVEKKAVEKKAVKKSTEKKAKAEKVEKPAKKQSPYCKL